MKEHLALATAIIYTFSFFLKNIITKINEKKPIRAHSIPVTMTIALSVLIHLIVLTNIFFKPLSKYFINIEVLNIWGTEIIGIISLIFSQLIGILCLFTMGKSWRVGIPKDQDTRLVTTGIFAFSRNPYFLSLNLMYLGYFLVFPNALLLSLVCLAISFIHTMILKEEAHLTKKHQQKYLEYMQKVRRYI
jgi:protein-S-isoprenylcysteine O-methyltransferase Ste14